MSKFYLKDWHGKEKEFTDEKIFVRGENGELIQFTQGEGDKPPVLQEKTITENGEYTADEGFDGLAKVLVAVAASGGSNLKIATGTIDTEKKTNFTIEHGLGVVPDFMYVCATTEDGYLSYSYGVSRKLLDKIAPAKINNLRAYYYSSKYYWMSDSLGIDEGGSGIRYATDKSATIVAGYNYKVAVGATWVAISFGLE